MRTSVTRVVAALPLAGCKKPPPPEPVSAAPTEEVALPPVTLQDEPAARADEKLVLNADKLTRFIGYQQKMLEVTAQALTDVRAIDQRADAGDYEGVTGSLAV